MRRFLRSKELNISRRKITYTFVALVVLAVAIWVLTHRTTAESDVPVVATVPVAQEDVNIYGEYVGRIYMCINNEPQYVIESSTDDIGEK